MAARRADRPRREGKPGQKWVDIHYDAKEAAKAQNGGVLPYTKSFESTWFPHCDEWNEENLPDILFYLIVPQSEYKGLKVEYLEEDGKPVKSDDGKSIRDFAILPRRIALNAPGWLLEAWRRIDCRITYQDILDRQVADPSYGGIGLRKLSKNALQNHSRRNCRKILDSWVEYGRRAEPHRTEVEAIEVLSDLNLVYNTILLPCEIAPHRLTKVKLVQKVQDGHYRKEPLNVTPENVQDTTFPIDHFVKHLSNPRPSWDMMRQPMKEAFEMLLKLQERAMLHQLPHWSKLDKSCLPVTWFDRTKKKLDKKTAVDGGCDVCTWKVGQMPPETPATLAKGNRSSRSKKRRRVSSEDSESAGDTYQCAKRTTQNASGKKAIRTRTPVSKHKEHATKYLESDETDSSAVDYQTTSEAGFYSDDADIFGDSWDLPLNSQQSDDPIGYQSRAAPRKSFPSTEAYQNMYPQKYGSSLQSPTANKDVENFRNIGAWIQNEDSGATSPLQAHPHFQTSDYLPNTFNGNQRHSAHGSSIASYRAHYPKTGMPQHLPYSDNMSCGSIANSRSPDLGPPGISFSSEMSSISTAATSLGETLEGQDEQFDLPRNYQYAKPPPSSYYSASSSFENAGTYYALKAELEEHARMTFSSPVKPTAPRFGPVSVVSRSTSFSEVRPPINTLSGYDEPRRQSGHIVYDTTCDPSGRVLYRGRNTAVNPSTMYISENNLTSTNRFYQERELHIGHSGRPTVSTGHIEGFGERIEVDTGCETPPPMELS